MSKPIITQSVPSPQDLQFLEDRLYEYNSQVTGKSDGQQFSFFIRDDQQQILAGLAGWTWAGACEIQSLWVHPEFRGHGYGAELLAAAEEQAHARGCTVILIESYSFQAPEFYQKHGYQLAWQLDDFPPGHRHCCLVKRLLENEMNGTL